MNDPLCTHEYYPLLDTWVLYDTEDDKFVSHICNLECAMTTYAEEALRVDRCTAYALCNDKALHLKPTIAPANLGITVRVDNYKGRNNANN